MPFWGRVSLLYHTLDIFLFILFSVNIVYTIFSFMKGNINRIVSVLHLMCTIVMVRNGTSSSYSSVAKALNLLGLSPKCLYIFDVYYAVYIYFFLFLHFTWWDWPLTWLTNHRPLVL